MNRATSKRGPLLSGNNNGARIVAAVVSLMFGFALACFADDSTTVGGSTGAHQTKAAGPAPSGQTIAPEDAAPIPFDPKALGSDWLVSRLAQTGQIDYAVLLDSLGRKEREAVDFNGDGILDDFYYFSHGVLIRREVDTNYDRRVDLRVWISEGVYISRYEQDVDFDGTPDVIRSYGKTSK